MKIKTSHSHPNALMNYLVTTSLIKRELFFLSCELNYLNSLILKDEPLDEILEKLKFQFHDYMCMFAGTKLQLGVRGSLHDLIDVCEWDINDYISMRRKEFGKACA